MVDTSQQTPSLVFPIPGYNGAISPHGAYNGGSDIMAPAGSNVVSMVSGKVDFISTQQSAPNSGGNAIEIHGTDGKDYYYAHLLNAPNVKVGDSVSAGQLIGQVDTTGNAKGGPAHLHIGIGYGITTGVRTSADPSAGGLGQNFDAVAMLRALVKDPRANNATIGTGDFKPNPPSITFNPSVPGFDTNHLEDIKLNLEQALAAGIDPYIWLGIVSKESNFNSSAVNPTSGACGYAQIYPCIPGLTPVQNIQEGIKRYKGFLDQCNGNVKCALNLYSGGGGPLYVGDVQGRADSIKSSNPSFGTPGFSIPTIGGTVGTPGSDNATIVDTSKCPPIKLGKIGPADIQFPDPTCLVRMALTNMVTSLTNWWKQWQEEHVPNWAFVGLGIILVIAGALALANSSGMQAPNINLPSGGAAATEGAPELAEFAAVL